MKKFFSISIDDQNQTKLNSFGWNDGIKIGNYDKQACQLTIERISMVVGYISSVRANNEGLTSTR